MKYKWVCFLANVCVCRSKCQFKETQRWLFVGRPVHWSANKARDYYSLHCHLNVISWMPPIKSHCSFKYYSLLMFNVSGNSVIQVEHILLEKET